jgi:hypothetical protein
MKKSSRINPGVGGTAKFGVMRTAEKVDTLVAAGVSLIDSERSDAI